MQFDYQYLMIGILKDLCTKNEYNKLDTLIENIPLFDVFKNYLSPPLSEQLRIGAKIEEFFTQLDNIANALK